MNTNNPHSTAPKPYRCPLNPGPRNVRSIFQVIDTSDGDAVIETFRNVHLANKLAAVSPTYQVRDYAITMRD